MEISKLQRVRNALLERSMLTLYCLFIAGYFLLPMAAGHRRFYYLLVFPATLLLLGDISRFYRGDRLAGLVVAYAAWMSLSLAWSADYSTAGALQQLWTSVNLLSFVAVTGFVWVRYADRLALLLPRLLWLAAAAALVSIIAWYSQHPFPASRLEPLGVMHHQNKSGAAYGLFFVMSVQFWLTAQDKTQRRVYLAIGLVLGSLVLLTQSRTALAGVCTGLLVLLGWRAVLVLVVGGAASWALLAMNPADWWHRVETFSFRPGIWRQVLADMSGHWVLGHGYLLDPHVQAYGREFNHAHNSYLATLRDGGAVGLGLLLAVLTTALSRAVAIFKTRGERIYLALLLYGMACIFMDFDRLLVQPKELWLFFWTPVALVMATFAYRGNRGLLRFAEGETS